MVCKARARFETRESQKEYFNNVKRKLSVSIRKLAKLLKVSDGGIESYCCGRTAPPIWIIKRLENLTGLGAVYVEGSGKIVRKRRRLMPMALAEAKEVLGKYFPSWLERILGMIEEGYTIKEIAASLRREKFVFDSSAVVKAIGAYKKNFLIRICDNISKESCIVVRGRVDKSKGDCTINFNLKPLAQLIGNDDKIRVRLEVSNGRTVVKLIPSKIGRKIAFIKGWGAFKIHIPVQLGLLPTTHVDILIPTAEFGLDFFDCIYDKDAVTLAKRAVERNLQIFPLRSTPNNRLGDLVFEANDKLVVIEITRALSRNCAHFKLGQSLMQKILHKDKDMIQLLVCKKGLFDENQKEALNFLRVNIIYTDFKNGWEDGVLSQMPSYLNDAENY
ncbi:MAG: hypothetical protein WC634_00720 [archaeon]